MLSTVIEEPTEEMVTTFWASPILVAIGSPNHATKLAGAAAGLAYRSDSMVVVYTVANAELHRSSNGRAEDGPAQAALNRALSTLDEYKIPYRVFVDKRPVSSVEPDRTRDLAWAIWSHARRCRAQSVVVGACGGIEPGLQVHHHIAANGSMPVVSVPLSEQFAGVTVS